MVEGIRASGSNIILENSLVVNNPTGGDCSGNITSQGQNLDSDGSCAAIVFSVKTVQDPLIGPLQRNGGETKTHGLLPSSPAIDAADNFFCPEH